MALNAGDMDREVTLQQLTETQGASGFPVEAWTTLDTVWASLMPVTGWERMRVAASELSAAFDTRWQIYYRADMDPELLDVQKTRRLVFNGRRYDIVSAQQLDRQEGLELLTLSSSEVIAT